MSLEVAVVGDASNKTPSYPSDAGRTEVRILPAAVHVDVSGKSENSTFLLQDNSTSLPEEQT